MTKRIGIIAAVCFAFAFCFALVGCGGVDKSAYVGTWDLESGSDESLSADSIELMKSLGLDVTITLKDDGTGSLNLFGEETDLDWEATSSTEGSVSFNGNSAALKLSDGKLILEDSTGSSMTFKKSDATASTASSASAEAASSEAASSEAAASDEAASSEAAASDEAASSEAASDEASADAEEASSSSAAA